MNNGIAKRLVQPLLSVSILALVLAGPAQAASGPDYARPGPYVGIGLGLGYENYHTDAPITDPSAGYGFDAWGGYRWFSWLATELQLEYLNGFNFRFNAPPEPGIGFEGEQVTFTGNVKVYPPMNWRIQPFALAGVGLGYTKFERTVADWKESDTGLAARFGGGVDFWVTENVALNANASYILQREQDDLLSSDNNLDYISVVIGAQMRF